jgi:hypothetical protein
MSEAQLLKTIRELRERNVSLFTKARAMEMRAITAERERDEWRDAAMKAMTALERVKERTAKLVQRLRDLR